MNCCCSKLLFDFIMSFTFSISFVLIPWMHPSLQHVLMDWSSISACKFNMNDVHMYVCILNIKYK